MAIAAVSPVYYGQPAASQAGGQVYNNGVPGPEGRILKGIATAILDGAATTFTLNYIDGVQKPFQSSILIPFSAVTAPATIGGVANQAVYSGVGATSQFRAGQSVVFAGFSNAGNNGTFTINAVSSNSLQVTNASSVAESNSFAATGAVTVGQLVAFVQAGRSLASAANVVDTATSTLTATASAFTQTGCTITISGAGTNLQTLSVFVLIYPAS